MIESRKMVFIGNGNQHISLVHPEDVVQCLRLALEKDKEGDVFNVVSFICSIKDFNNVSKKIEISIKLINYVVETYAV